MDPQLKVWREDKIRAAVSEEEADLILSVPIPLAYRADGLCWPHERSGKISARSAYHFIRSKAREAGASHDPNHQLQVDQNLWAAIWKTPVMPKVRTFAWKLLSKSVLVRERLVRRGLPVSPGCPVCNQIEMVEHLI